MENMVSNICEREKIKLQSIKPLRGGQINQVFLVNNSYVIRIGNGEAASDRLRQEAALLQSIGNQICVPKVYAIGQYCDCTYQIQDFVRGQKLHWVWKKLLPEQKNAIVTELVYYMKLLHQRTSQEFGQLWGEKRHYRTWLDFCEENLQSTLEELKIWKVNIDPKIIELVCERFDRDKSFLREGTPCLIHRDLWQGNILVEEDRITAILDFEFSMYAPVDYELLLIEEFCLYPNDFSEEDNEIYTAADFSDYVFLLKKHYPEMFSFRNLRKRLDLYHLLYSLSSYLNWIKTQSKDLIITFPLYPSAKALNFLFEHGIRMI
jgi:aminoglycoside phosphotransferase (APT) family kinase protein